jgi:aryl-alcohol dehydrogenase-like predicted oxidoreductase
MITRILGRTSLQVSVLGVGGHVYAVGDGPNDFRTPDQRAALIARLAAAGVNYWDTTWLNEVELLADSFRRAGLKEPGHVSLQFVDGISDPQWREKLRGEVERRLEVMGYSAAPLFIMGVGNHRPPKSEIRAAAEALHGLKEEGLVRHIGVSCHDLLAFGDLAEVIEETDLLDYLMIRYNWKFPQAAERLFPVAAAHKVGVVVMKVLCWDCGPDAWDRRISVFDPVRPEDRLPHPAELTPAQRSLQWCLETAPCATTVPSINAEWEAEQLIQAVEALDPSPATHDFPLWRDRLDEPDSLRELAAGAESHAVRGRARRLLEKV